MPWTNTWKRYGRPALRVRQLLAIVMDREDFGLRRVERELLAAYVSTLNGSRPNALSHAAAAVELGAPAADVDTLIHHRGVGPARYNALLRVAERITKAPAESHAETIALALEQGWSEEELADTILVVGLFNMVNRIMEVAEVNDDEARALGRHIGRFGYRPKL